jgi:hypothetical protein
MLLSDRVHLAGGPVPGFREVVRRLMATSSPWMDFEEDFVKKVWPWAKKQICGARKGRGQGKEKEGENHNDEKKDKEESNDQIKDESNEQIKHETNEQIFSGDVNPDVNPFSADMDSNMDDSASVQCTVDDLKKIGQLLFGKLTRLGKNVVVVVVGGGLGETESLLTALRSG